VKPFDSLISSIGAALPGLEPGDLLTVTPPNLALGDIAVPMFLPARRLKGAPPKLAAQVAEEAQFGGEVISATAAGPYLNLKVDRARFASRIVAQVLTEGAHYGAAGQGKGKRITLEHTSINPNASPHVGRARCAMIGDSVARLLRFEGYDVEVHYYVNDMGRQIGLLVLLLDELQGLTFDEILDAYVRANARAEADPDFAERGYAFLLKMEEGDPEVREKFRAVTDLCLQGQLAVLARVGATYDVFDRESKYLNDPRLEQIEAALRERGALFVDEDDRLVVDLSKLGYPHEEGRFFVLRRANGSSMYGYRDLAYTLDKAALGADLDIIILGEDHKLYQQQLSLILESAGFKVPEAIYYSYILLKDGKMSTRQGKVVLLSDFLDQAEARAAERVAEQCRDLAAEEQAAIARQVAVSAIRFAVLRVAPNKNVTFDMEASLSFTGDTGPYVQYCCARINSILRKAGTPAAQAPSGPLPLETDAEWALLLRLAEFPNTIAAALGQRSPAPIAVYCLDLAHHFTGFYHDCPVLTAESEALTAARLQLCRATLQVLTNALHLLGINAPERM